jgi:hypothetical protein
MKYKELYTITRPTIDAPFHSTDSIFYFDPADTTFTSPATLYFRENYVNAGKAIEGLRYLSEDGLTLTLETVYNSQAIIAEVWTDPFFADGVATRQEWQNEHGVTSTIEIIEIPG